MNLRFVETFVWVARLEAEMGCELFERLPGGVQLSTIGQRAVQPAEELLKAATSFRVAIGSPQHLKATVSIGTIDSIVHAWLPNSSNA